MAGVKQEAAAGLYLQPNVVGDLDIVSERSGTVVRLKIFE